MGECGEGGGLESKARAARGNHGKKRAGGPPGVRGGSIGDRGESLWEEGGGLVHREFRRNQE